MVIDGKDQRGAKEALLRDLDLVQVLDRDVENLSGPLSQLLHVHMPNAQKRIAGKP